MYTIDKHVREPKKTNQFIKSKQNCQEQEQEYKNNRDMNEIPQQIKLISTGGRTTDERQQKHEMRETMLKEKKK